METGKGVSEKKGTTPPRNDVILQISGNEEAFEAHRESSSSSSKLTIDPNNIELARKSPPSIHRSTLSKPKSRLIEPPHSTDSKARSSSSSSPSNVKASPRETRKSSPITPKTPLIGGTPVGEEDEAEEVYQTANLKVSQEQRSKTSKLRRTLIAELTLLISTVGILIASLTVTWFEGKLIWGLEIWKWCVLILVIFCGRLFTEWFINVVVFLVERNYLMQKKVLYFVYGLKRSIQIFLWIGLILSAWALLFHHRGPRRSRRTSKILGYVTRGLASCLIGAAIWVMKNLLVKLLASSFQCSRFFDRIQEAIFRQYVLRVLSGPRPAMGEIGRSESGAGAGRLSFRNVKGEKEEKRGGKEEVIDVEKLRRTRQEKVSAWTMKGLISVIRGTGLSTISNALEEEEEEEEEIGSEWEAKAAAYRIFRNVAKPGSKYIEEDDLLRFLRKEDVDLLLPMFEGAVESGKIKRKSLKNWLVNVYLERKALVHSLNDTKTAIEELNKLASAFVIVVIIIVWLVLMGLLTTQVLVLVSSQILLIAFMFGNTAKTVFEAIIFVFVMHPFDVGDRCVVDGVQMVVEEMNILTTIFLRYDNEKIFYPNSVLATKPISNFYRSPEMGDGVEFGVDFSTSIETISAFKAKVKMYLESKPQFWRAGHSVVVKDIEDVNKISIALYVTHTINFQNYGDKSNRRSELVLELKRIFEELGIKYCLLPQEVRVSYAGSPPSTFPPPRL